MHNSGTFCDKFKLARCPIRERSVISLHVLVGLTSASGTLLISFKRPDPSFNNSLILMVQGGLIQTSGTLTLYDKFMELLSNFGRVVTSSVPASP